MDLNCQHDDNVKYCHPSSINYTYLKEINTVVGEFRSTIK